MRRLALCMPTAKSTSKTSKSRSSTAAAKYTKPELRDRLKAKILRGTKGGRAGEWSARKAQLLAHEYEAAGGGYSGRRSKSQKHLSQWTEEKWTTRDGKPAKRGRTMARYLPAKAWDELAPSQQKATDQKKRSASRKGKQTVRNTKAATRAGRHARKSK